MRRTSLDGIPAGIAPWSLVEELLECLGMGIELLLKDVEALEAMFTDCDQLSMESLEAVQGSDFGHDELLCCSDFNASQCLEFAPAEMFWRVWVDLRCGGGSRRPSRWRQALTLVELLGAGKLSRTVHKFGGNAVRLSTPAQGTGPLDFLQPC